MNKARVIGIQIQSEIGDKKANLDKVQKTYRRKCMV